jgi:hypothetical protein
MRLRVMASVLAAGAAGIVIAVAVGSAGAAGQTMTIGSTTGDPTMNICLAMINCTYVPFNNVSVPELVVPFDGTVTSFSVKSMNTGGTVSLRVLRPAGGGQYTGVGTSSAKTLTVASPGVNTYTVSLPVKQGDVLGLDNDSSALMFDASSSTPITAYYQLPSLADGSTAAPNNTRTGLRLLLEATVQSSGTTTTTGSTGTNPTINPPAFSNISQSHRRWREGKKLAKFSSVGTPVGTTFRFTLSEPARVRFAFSQLLPGRKVNGKCVAPTSSNRSKPRCTRVVRRGALSHSESAGAHRLFFDGRLSSKKRLPIGRYRVTITAINTAGLHSTPHTLTFRIVAG